MSLKAFLKEYSEKVQRAFDEAIEGLSHEQAHWTPGGSSNHIAFVAWHYVRTVDNVVQFVLQRQPTVWMEEKWDQKFGLDSKAQGTGMSHEDALALRLSDLTAFSTYTSEVWGVTRDYLDSVSQEQLDSTTKMWPFGELTVSQALGTTMLAHGYTHLGEIWTLKGIQGLRGASA